MTDTYIIYLSTGASASVEVEADDLDQAYERAHDLAPRICAQCSGWGQSYSLDLGDDWEAEDEYELNGEYIDPKRSKA